MQAVNPTQWVLLAGVILAVGLLMLGSVRRHRNPGLDPSEYAREQIARLKDQKGVKDDLQQLVVELHDAARRLNAQMDTKAARLEALIRDADERIGRLHQAQSGSVSREGDVRGVDLMVDDSAQSDSASSAEPGEPPDPVRHRILSLSAKGNSAVEIARETGVKPGEIELILALHASATGDRRTTGA